MMFLLKMTFWIMLIFLLLPGSREDNRNLMTAAEKTVQDFGSFCSRNPDVCANARSAVTSLLSRVKNGAEMVEGWVDRRPGPPVVREDAPAYAPRYETPKAQDRPYVPEGQSRPSPLWNNSLNPADRQLPWRGPTGS